MILVNIFLKSSADKRTACAFSAALKLTITLALRVNIGIIVAKQTCFSSLNFLTLKASSSYMRARCNGGKATSKPF